MSYQDRGKFTSFAPGADTSFSFGMGQPQFSSLGPSSSSRSLSSVYGSAVNLKTMNQLNTPQRKSFSSPMPARTWSAHDFGGVEGSTSYSSYTSAPSPDMSELASLDSFELATVSRHVFPPTPEERSNQILDKLEQAGRVPSKEKFRRMACNTFIFTGACPYNDRCVFLHDYRIKAEGMKLRTTRQAKSNPLIKDTFYWPDMMRKDVIRNTDSQGLPTANQMYLIPESFKQNPGNFHNRGLFSIWNHFVEFCTHNNTLLQQGQFQCCDISDDPFFQISGYRQNLHIPGANRLVVLIGLSLGMSIQHDNASVNELFIDRCDQVESVSRKRRVQPSPLNGEESVEPQIPRLLSRKSSDWSMISSLATVHEDHDWGLALESEEEDSLSGHQLTLLQHSAAELSNASTLSSVRCNNMMIEIPIDEMENFDHDFMQNIGKTAQLSAPQTSHQYTTFSSLTPLKSLSAETASWNDDSGFKFQPKLGSEARSHFSLHKDLDLSNWDVRIPSTSKSSLDIIFPALETKVGPKKVIDNQHTELDWIRATNWNKLSIADEDVYSANSLNFLP